MSDERHAEIIKARCDNILEVLSQEVMEAVKEDGRQIGRERMSENEGMEQYLTSVAVEVGLALKNMHATLQDRLVKLRVDAPWYDEMLEKDSCNVLRWTDRTSMTASLAAFYEQLEDSEQDSEEEPEEDSEEDSEEAPEEDPEEAPEGDTDEETEQETEALRKQKQRWAERGELIHRMRYTFSLPQGTPLPPSNSGRPPMVAVHHPTGEATRLLTPPPGWR